MERRRFAWATAAAALAAGACAPQAHVATPPPLASKDWSGSEAQPAKGALPTTSLAALLSSPELATLTRSALTRNADVRIAEARVAQAAAQLRNARMAVLPEVTFSAAGSRQRQLGSALPDFRDFFARLDVDLDVDLFGRLGSAKIAARERVRAAGLERDAVALAVEAAVASAFVQRSALQRQIEILDQNIDRAVELERVIRVRYDEGAATKVDLGLQTTHVLSLREQRSRLSEALDQTRTALALLAGEEAPVFQFAPGRIDELSLPALAPPAPAALLAERPDVLAAEALIAAANGDVNVARASFLPQIGVSLSGLLEDTTTGPLSKVVNLGSSLLAPIFSRGKLEGDLAYASAVQVEAVESYRKSILTALGEVEDARSTIAHSAERAELIDRIVEQARETARLANLQYIEGEEDLQSVLDAQQNLSDAEEAQVLAQQEQLAARISLYRAMGGYHGAIAEAAPRLAY